MGGRTYRLTLCYDGTRYRGWQRLPNCALTVQGKIEEALSGIFGMPIEVSGSGRTDAGVHAKGQVASFHAPELPIGDIVPKLRHLLPEDIGVTDLSYAPERFHARLCAARKTYRYRVWNSVTPDVFERRFRAQLPQPLDVAKMREAAKLLEGKHDFLGFCANKHFKKSSARTLYALTIEQDGNELRFTLTADGFLYHMARILVGTLLEIGGGRRELGTIAEIFEKKNRALAGETAPAKGLCLMEVRYE